MGMDEAASDSSMSACRAKARIAVDRRCTGFTQPWYEVDIHQRVGRTMRIFISGMRLCRRQSAAPLPQLLQELGSLQ